MLNIRTGEVTPTDAGRLVSGEDELRIYIIVRKDLVQTKPGLLDRLFAPIYRLLNYEPKPNAMSRGKFGAQCAHAALTAWVCCYNHDPDRANAYMARSQAKIVLQVRDESELRKLYDNARKIGFEAAIITDAGRTEFAEPTLTCIAIGPIWHKTEGQPFLRRVQLYKG